MLLLDEPTAALDIGRQQQVLELVDELRARRRADGASSAMHDLTLAGAVRRPAAAARRAAALVAAAAPREVADRGADRRRTTARDVRVVDDDEAGRRRRARCGA